MNSTINNIKSDFIASVVVWLVALPLCLGIALASGAPLFSGILSGIIGGIVVGLLSASSVSVSGPAAGLITVVLTAITQLGNYHVFLLAVLIAGILQIIIGLLRVGFISDYVPSNVIQGLLAAIGIMVIITQIPLACGFNQHLSTSFYRFFRSGSLHAVETHFNVGAMIISVVTLLIMIYWDKFAIKTLRVIPAAVIAVIIAILLNVSFNQFFPTLALNHYHLIDFPDTYGLSGFFSQLMTPDFSAWRNYNVYVYAVILAIVASLETVLNLEASEKLDKKNRYASRNRELFAQGVGNACAGLFGGMPITSVIIRSSVNINSGAKTKCSTIFHGTIMLIGTLFFARWLDYIPLATLAGILIYTGYKLCNPKMIMAAYNKGLNYFIPLLGTIIGIVFSDLLKGIIFGLLLSAAFILYNYAKSKFTEVHEKHPSGMITRFILPQRVSFLSKAAIIRSLNTIPEKSRVIIDAWITDYIDQDILDVIRVFRDVQSKNKKISLNLEGFKRKYAELNQLSFIEATSYDVVESLSAQQILTILKEGNHRYLNETPIHRNRKQRLLATAEDQNPMALVLACIDSRVPVELVFDVSIGDLFVTRVAANILNESVLASIEYAAEVVGVKLIVVLGHTNNGLIKVACDRFKVGHMADLIKKIEPAIELEIETRENRDGSNVDFVNNVARNHVKLTLDEILQQSDIISSRFDQGKVALLGAVYDVKTGKVDFGDLICHHAETQSSLEEQAKPITAGALNTTT
ncbi:MAG: SulP family inorganic anion transporter [Pseudomonadota bacterium]